MSPSDTCLRGVKLVISDAHLGIKAAVAKVLKSTWQRCRVLARLQHAGGGRPGSATPYD